MSTSTVFVNSEQIPDGYYTIKNNGMGSLVALPPRQKDLCGGIPGLDDGSFKFLWSITSPADGRYIIRSWPSDLVVQCAPVPKENGVIYVDRESFIWNIQQVSAVQPDCYLICSPAKERLVWSLADKENGTPLLFAQCTSNPRFRWCFARATAKEIEAIHKEAQSTTNLSQPHIAPNSNSLFRSNLPSTSDDISNRPSLQSELQDEAPPYPAYLFGRDDFISTAIDLILTKHPARLAIQGAGGVGKTTVAAAIFSEKTIDELYQTHKAFVSCEALTSADQLIENLCHGFHLNIHQKKPLEILKNFLKSLPMILLVLDNFETVWDRDQRNVLTLLKLLDSFTQLTLLITTRSLLRPGASDIRWTQPALPELQVLTSDAAMKIFKAIASVGDDTGLKELVESVECLPLAVVLLAHYGQMNISPSQLLEMWQTEQTALLVRNSDSKSDCLETSISLSL